MRERKIEKYLIKSPKQMLMVIAVFTLMIFVGGTTYAFFNYTRTGDANTIRVGRISFVTRQTKTISLTNLFPIDPTNSEEMSDETKVGTLEIEIEGDTDYNQGVEYLVSSTNTRITTSTGKLVPISLDVTVANLGTSNPNYFTAREDKNATIYKKLVGDTIVGDQMLLVGFIKPNTTSGTIEGVNGKITIKAYLDENKILISDTYDGTESDNMGTPNSMAIGKTVLTTTEWNAISNTGISFQIKVEANEGIWVKGSLEEIMKQENFDTTKNRGILDNEQSEFVSASTGIDFGAVSSDTNGKGVYMRAGTENDAYPILYYRGAVEDNNIIFNNKCWKAVRTTDTGGVKLIYNGTPVEVTTYSKDVINITDEQLMIDTNTSNFIYNSSDNSWNAILETGTLQEFSFHLPNGGNYTFTVTGTATQTGGGSILFYKNGSYVSGQYGTGGGGGAAISEYTHTEATLNSNDTMKFTTEFSGSSSLSPTIIKIKITGSREIFVNGCKNLGTATQITLNINETPTNKFAFNTSLNSPAYVGYMYGTVYPYSTSNWASGARFGSGFTWDGTNYKLVDATVTNPDATHHYSCNSTDADATCTDLRYVYYTYNNNATKYYITLTGGDGVEEALTKMNTNTNNSNAKTQIDTWYASNMNTVTSKLEDTVWCNDRSIGRYNGWSATGTINWTSDYNNYSLLFGAYERSNHASNTSTVKNQPSLTCANRNDAFTVSNGNGNQKLTYPVALLTEDEIVLAGGLAGSQSQFYLNNGSTYYWSLSPYYFSETNAFEFGVFNGYINNDYVKLAGDLRPSVSLKPGTPVVKGTGTVSDPYVIE